MPRTTLAALSALALGTTLALAGCSGSIAPTATPSPAPSATETKATIAVIGDSLATGSAVDGTSADPGSWTEYLRSNLTVIGGWHENGATSAEMAAGVQPVSVDALLIVAGTNDVLTGVPAATTVADIEKIATVVTAKTVVLGAVPPDTANQAAAAALNATLEATAKSEGWVWVDPWKRDRSGTDWAAGVSLDGIHPSLAVYHHAGTRLSHATWKGIRAAG
jgi:GDSL-like Lipase/Acylhydrolase family